MSEKDNSEWPHVPQDAKFDWSLSLRDIDKRYGVAPPLQATPKRQLPDRIDTFKISAKRKVPYSNSSEFEKWLVKKYPYLYSMLVDANPDLPRWLYDNLIKNNF